MMTTTTSWMLTRSEVHGQHTVTITIMMASGTLPIWMTIMMVFPIGSRITMAMTSQVNSILTTMVWTTTSTLMMTETASLMSLRVASKSTVAVAVK